jgi:bifunctional UDP-N-acetylglucosamine pyrophosphorylase/glucosamine-1-phosphate N-acetyltransferase
MQNAPHILILAAGRGSRMRSALPKVLHPVLFRPMVEHVLELAMTLPHRSISVVVGHGEAAVREACRDYDVRFFRQERQLGTADAVRAAQPFLASAEGDLLILSGDVVLLRPQTVWELLRRHAEEKAACTIAVTRAAAPKGYGRIIRRDDRVVDIREDVDCAPDERAITEVNGGAYCFGLRGLFEALPRIGNGNGQGEYYLPDAVRLLAGGGAHVAAAPVDAQELQGVNDLAELAAVEAALRRRVNAELMLSGVRLQEPETTFIDSRCRFGHGVTIEGGCTLIDSELGDGVTVERGSRLLGATVAEGAYVKQGSYIEKSLIGARSLIGPYAHLRPGTRLGENVKVGNFVEIKNSVLGDGSKASHLTYIGDAELGRNVNVGCGFITCNSDGGPTKLRTTIGDDVFLGSDVQAVAPVTIGRGAFVAAGSTVTEDVPEDSLAISRGRQTTKPGYARKLKERRAAPAERPS